jgi:hypothetical protein
MLSSKVCGLAAFADVARSAEYKLTKPKRPRVMRFSGFLKDDAVNDMMCIMRLIFSGSCRRKG